MRIDLRGKSILVGVTGSISAYKACEVVREFVKAGASVGVVMTPSATRFVTPLTFEALTRNHVLVEASESWTNTLNHIDSGKSSDIFVITPASANSINKLASGVADNILLQTALAYNKPLLIAPSANTQMLLNEATKNSLKSLQRRGITVVETQHKLLACGDLGTGALAEPREIFFQSSRLLLLEHFWEDREVIITGGGTREKIDEVRYLSNFSSGKMAKALALALYTKGAKVTYITTMDRQGLPLEMKSVLVESASQMFEATKESISQSNKSKMPYLFMVAAVADYTPASPKHGKLKKRHLGSSWELPLQQTTDILASLEKRKIKTIAFKAEMNAQQGLNNATDLIKSKGVDGVCYNLLKSSEDFGRDENRITFISPKGRLDLGRGDKLTLSYKIIDQAKEVMHG
jgi:phosphopantothenoylcysteine decarboxylase/phosphopantothenate--cysteine ligase